MRHRTLLSAVLIAACASPFAVDDDAIPLTITDEVSLQFERGSVTGRYALSVPFWFTNATQKTLTMVYCSNDRPLLERLGSGGWVYENGGDDYACLSTREIQPGEEIRDTARFVWGIGSETFRTGRMAGTYRLRWYQLWADFHGYDSRTDSWGTRIPERLLVSNPFEVREP